MSSTPRDRSGPNATSPSITATDLRNYVSQLRTSSQGFAAALRDRDNDRSIPLSPTCKSTPQLRNPLSRAGQERATLTLPSPSTSHQQTADAEGAELQAALEQYAHRMAERALTANGRALKTRATTKLEVWDVVCYGSVLTRGAKEVLREVGGFRPREEDQ